MSSRAHGRHGHALARAAAGVLLVTLGLVLAGCGGAGGDEGEGGTAELWITRDRGAEVLARETVPAGITALDALDRVADVETRFGGRFVQSIDGVAGSAAGRRDWFWFVNGYEADRSAAEYRLSDGDVEWWDYRDWKQPGEARVVLGAFPEPFRHGYDGTRRTAVVHFLPGFEGEARALAEVVGAGGIAAAPEPDGGKPPEGANLLVVGTPGSRSHAELCHGGSAGAPVCVYLSARHAGELAGDPAAFRHRFEVTE